MNTALQECVNGLVLGGIYALIALGYSMVYGVVGLINFAHGEIVMMGALSCISSLGMLLGLHVAVPLALLGAVLFSMTVCMALGWGITTPPDHHPNILQHHGNAHRRNQGRG